MHLQSQQGTCRHDVIFPCVFAKVFQGSQRLRAFLNFVKNNQRFPGCQLATGFCLNQKKQPLHIIPTGEGKAHILIAVKTDKCHFLVMLATKLLHEPGLTNLSRTHDKERLPHRAVLPLQQLLFCVSLHGIFLLRSKLSHFSFIINTNLQKQDDFLPFHPHFADDFLPFWHKKRGRRQRLRPLKRMNKAL